MAKLLLRRNTNSNTFCVPAAVALISGQHVDDVIKMIQEDLGDRPITGLFYPMGLKYLEKLGFKYERVNTNNPAALDVESTYYLCLRGHAAVIHEGLYYDNANPNGVEIKISKHAVESLWKVWKE